jgi:hypothetical protein
VARAELAAAVALLDEIQAQPATVPAGLMGRAAGVLAASEQNHQRVSAVAVTPVARYRRSMAWSGFALAVLAVIAVPTVLKMVGDGTTIAVKQGEVGDTISRTIVVTPPSPTKKKDGQSCIDANEQARKSTPDNMGAVRPGEAPSKNNDPCGPKPTGAGKHERPISAGSN